VRDISPLLPSAYVACSGAALAFSFIIYKVIDTEKIMQRSTVNSTVKSANKDSQHSLKITGLNPSLGLSVDSY
jgi:hypothetical protein